MSQKVKEALLTEFTDAGEDTIFKLVVQTNNKEIKTMTTNFEEIGVKIRNTFDDEIVTFTVECTGQQALKIMEFEFTTYMRKLLSARTCAKKAA